MSWPMVRVSVSAWFFGGLLAFAPPANVNASEPASARSETPVPSIDLFEGIRAGALSVSAEGSGNGRMVLSVKNRGVKGAPGGFAPGVAGARRLGSVGWGGVGGGGGGRFGRGGVGGGRPGGLGGGRPRGRGPGGGGPRSRGPPGGGRGPRHPARL